MSWSGISLRLLLLVLRSLAQEAQAQPAAASRLTFIHGTTRFLSSPVRLVANAQDGGRNEAIWIFGGRAKTSYGQAENTWTNALLKLDLSEPWSTGAPPIEVVQSDRNSSNAPPRVALGAFWSSKDGNNLLQYNGQFSDTPPQDPTAHQVWEYSISNNAWSTVDTQGTTPLRVAEGAGALVPSLGDANTAFYFGGHEDVFTVEDWSGRRVYLSSMTSFDFGTSTWTNASTFSSVGSSGSRNSSTSNVAPILRADATMTYVPNLGTDNKGVLVLIGGGNDNQMIDNSVLDIYDVGAGAFVKQPTQGQIMTPRVNHCAVRGSAVVGDEEQHMIYVYGGQPSNRSTQLTEGQSTDMYILTLPSYTWTYVGSNLTSQPTARAGHTCELLGDQMISIGGYIAEDILCEQPGIWVFNTTSLEWITDFTPGRNFTTPELLKGLTGGTGTSNSTGGNGWAGPVNDYNPATVTQSGPTTTVTSDPSRMQDSESKSRLGPIIGGVLGGAALLALVAFLVNFFAKKQRRRERNRFQSRLLGQDRYTWSAADDDDASSLHAFGYSDLQGARTLGAGAIPLGSPHEGSQRAPMYARNSSRESGSERTQRWSESADDDVEANTEGMQVSGMTHLTPKENLRVMNPSVNRSRSSLGYSATQRSTGTL